jgi:hypothetical protein
VSGKAVHITASAEATARSAQRPVCDACIAKADDPLILTAGERHRRFHA